MHLGFSINTKASRVCDTTQELYLASDKVLVYAFALKLSQDLDLMRASPIRWKKRMQGIVGEARMQVCQVLGHLSAALEAEIGNDDAFTGGRGQASVQEEQQCPE